MKTTINLFLICTLILSFTGCAYQNRKPSVEFAPVRPPDNSSKNMKNGSIYQKTSSIRLFESNRARRVGDILTVVFDEKHVAKKETKTEDKKTGSFNLPSPTVFGMTGASSNLIKLLNTNISSTNDFKQKGKSEQKDSLTGSISVSVVEVLSNGNLVIRGEKLLTLNQGDEFVQVSGIVRVIDLGSDNMIVSSKIANAKIVYSGQGMTHDSGQGGWGSRFFLSDKWPF